jgi:hypothetical protein
MNVIAKPIALATMCVISNDGDRAHDIAPDLWSLLKPTGP